MRRPGFLLLLLFGVVTNAVAQSAGTLLRAGDAASAADHHVEAIAAYEAAIVQRPALRGELTAKLGRQYLWAGKTRRAVGLLRDSLTGHPEDCDVRFDYALALSWSNELRDAHREYQQLEQRCPARRQQARLRAAQIDRWQDRQSAATALYRQVLAEGSEEERRDARVGLGFVELEKDYNRSASTVFSNEPRSASAVVYEGSALAAVRLGDPTAAGSIIRRAEAANAVSPDLADVREELQRRDHAAITPRMTISRDADGTSYRSTELGGSFGWMRRGQADAMFGTSSVQRGREQIDDRWAGASIEHRFAQSFALVASGRLHTFDSIAFRPTTGELDLVVTPTDRTRIDAAAARILISDNLAALRQHLAGNFVSLGIDQRLTYRTTVSLSADDTRWNTQNERQRVRFNIIHRFEGVPRVTVEWPSLYMRYDQGFAFSLFSPRRYVETGPGINVYRRFARHWNAAAYLRVGVQQEEALGWKQLAIARLSLDRDLHDVWAFGIAASWSNSNLASSTGFRRTAVSLNLTRRF
jgi:tetratricopeptide (TPR) repeat protein